MARAGRHQADIGALWQACSRVDGITAVAERLSSLFRSERQRMEDKVKRIVRISWLRTYRPWHWLPRVYPGVNGVTTRLLVIGWLGVEYYPNTEAKGPRSGPA